MSGRLSRTETGGEDAALFTIRQSVETGLLRPARTLAYSQVPQHQGIRTPKDR